MLPLAESTNRQRETGVSHANSTAAGAGEQWRDESSPRHSFTPANAGKRKRHESSCSVSAREALQTGAGSILPLNAELAAKLLKVSPEEVGGVHPAFAPFRIDLTNPAYIGKQTSVPSQSDPICRLGPSYDENGNVSPNFINSVEELFSPILCDREMEGSSTTCLTRACRNLSKQLCVTCCFPANHR